MLTKLLCEFGATALMIVFGVGVHCDTVLKGTKYQGSGHMFCHHHLVFLASRSACLSLAAPCA